MGKAVLQMAARQYECEKVGLGAELKFVWLHQQECNFKEINKMVK
jgi:hypothetical protein